MHSLKSHPGYTDCGAADNVVDAWELVESRNPDAAIVDLRLRNESALDFIKRLANRYPHVRIIVSSMYDQAVYEHRCFVAGAHAYIPKEWGIEKLLAALDGNATTTLDNPDFLTSGLTDRELQVFQMIGEGQSTHQIATTLHRSVKTIESYRARIKKKLQLERSEELARDAARWVLERNLA